MKDAVCCPFLRRNHHNKGDDGDYNTSVYWKQLLESRGETLWTIRQRLVDSSSVASNNTGSIKQCQQQQQQRLGIHSKYHSGPPRFVHVMWSPQNFVHAETEFGLDKKRNSNTTSNGNFKNSDQNNSVRRPQPLTECTGPEWERQRALMLRALQDLVKRSLTAAQSVSFDHFQRANEQSIGDSCTETTRIDLKEEILKASIDWLIHLFRGSQDTALGTTCLGYWRVVRSLVKNQDEIEQNRKAFIQSLRWDNGLLKAFRDVGFSELEASDNAANAMIAALDAVQALVFWTLWNLSKRPAIYAQARKWAVEEATREDAICRTADLAGLASFKKAATQGKAVDTSKLSIVARAITETVRFFPPVWTLPRDWPVDSTAVASKVDVLLVNQATRFGDWDPTMKTTNTQDDGQRRNIGSFGLGKRHCPAGTAALYAVHHILVDFLQRVEILTECEPGRALRTAYLGPTLSIEGQQIFYIKTWQN